MQSRKNGNLKSLGLKCTRSDNNRQGSRGKLSKKKLSVSGAKDPAHFLIKIALLPLNDTPPGVAGFARRPLPRAATRNASSSFDTNSNSKFVKFARNLVSCFMALGLA